MSDDGAGTSLPLDRITRDFASAMASVDARGLVAKNKRSGAEYQPGIGPQTEADTIKLVIEELATRQPDPYAGCRINVPYAAIPRQRCDLVIPSVGGDWHLEFKLLRIMGDNGKPIQIGRAPASVQIAYSSITRTTPRAASARRDGRGHG